MRSCRGPGSSSCSTGPTTSLCDYCSEAFVTRLWSGVGGEVYLKTFNKSLSYKLG